MIAPYTWAACRRCRMAWLYATHTLDADRGPFTKCIHCQDRLVAAVTRSQREAAEAAYVLGGDAAVVDQVLCHGRLLGPGGGAS